MDHERELEVERSEHERAKAKLEDEADELRTAVKELVIEAMDADKGCTTKRYIDDKWAEALRRSSQDDVVRKQATNQSIINLRRSDSLCNQVLRLCLFSRCCACIGHYIYTFMTFMPSPAHRA